MQNWTIRAYDAADRAACAGVFERAWNAGHPYAPRHVDEAGFAAATIDETIAVAAAEGGLLGFVSVYVSARFIHHLYVDPPQFGRGVGRTLLARGLTLAGGRATLKCQARNARAVAFYVANGWTPGETGESEGEAWVRMSSPQWHRSRGAR